MSIAQTAPISGRLSLRAPQREALEILDRVCQLVQFEKDTDVAQALERIKAEFPSVEDFEREFPSLCFALATGVGKTRLMGAFIAYLYQAEGIRHFFVLAPNLTIYNKLVADFTPNTPKYVFQGLADFAINPPEIITGDNYESGRGIRKGALFATDEVHVNIFNISKINSEVRGGKAPRIKRLSEYIGESYFEYLSKLDDLVLLMDESHRYRASAGVRAINELRPILGLELTATPQVERGAHAEPFKNVIYSYPLSAALNDGFVKEPAVATRENFDARNYNEDGLERLKLEDGIRIHEESKVQLQVFAKNNQQKTVKPFMLVVAQHTEHANALVRTVEGDDFFEGRYKGRVITVHSAQTGEEKDETVQQLLTVEDPANPVQIVVHVNMLKEGWDVTNLYTIVPLRAANSRTLVEQSIGRGLRLPYGKRTGTPAVDRLTIVSHDRFQEIIDEANRADSIIRTGVVIGRDIPDHRSQVIEVRPEIENRILGGPYGPDGEWQPSLFENPREQEAAEATLQVIRDFERLPRSVDLRTPEVQQQIVERVALAVRPAQADLPGMAEPVDIPRVVAQTVDLHIELSIDIPRIVVTPKGEVTCRYNDFDLDVNSINYPPVDAQILIQHLHDHVQYRLMSGDGVVEEDRLEDYLVRGLIDFDDISYDDHADLLYKLAGQVVRRLQSYMSDPEQVKNVLQYHAQALVNLIHAQMQEHYEEIAAGYEAHVSKGFDTLRVNAYSIPAGERVCSFRTPVDDRLYIRSMLFGGFKKCLYPGQKFDSDAERRFAVVLENDGEVLKWFKPGRGVFRIHYHHDAEAYEPDFVVETEAAKYLCEPKRASEMTDGDVQAKAEAAATWCRHATEHEGKHGGKPWSYLLIPHDAIADNKTVRGLAAAFTCQPQTS
ncbi:MAG: DEAD/DEAH box helicase family protein [Planctomycetes bacterium]|nr:DEAD/DEAH box helicase family protein [Planctomycetota bacterium]